MSKTMTEQKLVTTQRAENDEKSKMELEAVQKIVKSLLAVPPECRLSVMKTVCILMRIPLPDAHTTSVCVGGSA